jgi:hypothetical protein
MNKRKDKVLFNLWLSKIEISELEVFLKVDAHIGVFNLIKQAKERGDLEVR